MRVSRAALGYDSLGVNFSLIETVGIFTHPLSSLKLTKILAIITESHSSLIKVILRSTGFNLREIIIRLVSNSKFTCRSEKLKLITMC